MGLRRLNSNSPKAGEYRILLLVQLIILLNIVFLVFGISQVLGLTMSTAFSLVLFFIIITIDIFGRITGFQAMSYNVFSKQRGLQANITNNRSIKGFGKTVLYAYLLSLAVYLISNILPLAK